jgi:hypothetical protein
MKKQLLLRAVTVFIIGLVLSTTQTPVSAADNAVTVDSLVFATAVDSRNPVGAATEFAASAGRVICWTKLSAAVPPATVTHIWYKNGQKLLEVPLTVNHASGRYWSQKNIMPGEWKVEVVDKAGNALASGTFMVK